MACLFSPVQLQQAEPVHVKEADGVFSLNWSTPAAYVPEKFFIQLKISTDEVLNVNRTYLFYSALNC